MRFGLGILFTNELYFKQKQTKMERLKIKECMAFYKQATGKKMNNRILAQECLSEMDCATSTKEQRIANWNSGKSFSGFSPKYLKAIKETLKVNYEILIEV